MKQVLFNHQIHPALERKVLWRTEEPPIRSKREQFQTAGIYLLRLIIIVALLLAVLSASASPGYDGNPKRRVAVVLSGGGAKGIAHIGVLKALEEHGVPIDYIAGTSIGAIVGGMYAAGYSPDEIEKIVLSKEFENASRGEISEDYVYYFLKQQEDPAWINFHFGWEDRFELQNIIRSNIPTNIVSPILMDFMFMELLGPASAAANYNFDRLFVPFRCIATDIQNKVEVAFDRGNLADAVRASMTYPFYFKPIAIDGNVMMDGGMLNNFPADIVQRDFNPDVVIGVVVSDNPAPPSPNDLISQLQNMLMFETRYEIFSPFGLIISPDVPQLNVTDFSQNEAMIKVGYSAAMEKMGDIFSMINDVRPADVVAEKRLQFRDKTPDPVIGGVIVNGLDACQEDYVKFSLLHKPGPESLSMVRENYLRLLANHRFQHVYPRMIYNAETGFFDLLIEMEPSPEITRSIGGNVSSQSINQAFGKVRYQKLCRTPFTLASNLFFGNLYNSGNVSGRIDFPGRFPFFISSEFVISQWKYTTGPVFFFEEQKPSFITQREMLAELRVGLPVNHDGKIEFGGVYADMKNNFYNSRIFSRSDTADISLFSPWVAFITFEKSTLNRKQFANRGSFFNLTLRHIGGVESHTPGSTNKSLAEVKQKHSWWEVKGYFENYFLPESSFNPGFVAEFFYSNRPEFANSTSTLLASPQFNPFPLASTRFMPEFRSNRYLALGLKTIYCLTRKFHLQAEGYFYQPLRQINLRTNLNDGPKDPISKPSFMGNLALIYNTAPGPLSMSFSYFQHDPQPWTFMINFGYILFNRKAFN